MFDLNYEILFIVFFQFWNFQKLSIFFDIFKRHENPNFGIFKKFCKF